MKLVIQRVKSAEVIIDQKTYSKIEQGLLVYVAFKAGDGPKEIEKAVNKLKNLRIFEDENEKMNLDISKVNGEVLLVSQFTLYADLKRGNRPSFKNSLNGIEAIELYDLFVNYLSAELPTKTGVFGANMQIKSINDGPVTIIYELGE